MPFPPSLQDLKDLFFGAVNWQQRVQPTIKFVSPEGKSFEAKWRKNTRYADKKLGIYFYPKVKGNVVDDLGINSSRLPITIYFDGVDNDKIGRAFYAAAAEQGIWEVIHPVHGFFGLQLVSIRESTDPVESGNITQIDTEWIEPIDPDTLETDRELAGIVDSLSDTLNQSAIDQFVSNVQTFSAAAQNAIQTTTQGIQNVSDYLLSPLTTLNNEVFALNNATQNAINDGFNETVVDTVALGGQLQNLLEFPSLATNSLQNRLDAYTDLSEGLLTVMTGGVNQAIPNGASLSELKNNVATTELALNAGIVGFAQIAVTSTDLQTRPQALEAAQNLADNFNAVMSAMEAQQVLTEDNDIDEKFFAQLQSYADAALLTYKAIRYLQLKAFDLKTEKRFILDRARSTIEIAITEYGELGENDANYVLFLDSNGLKDKDTIMLPAGREVVIYV